MAITQLVLTIVVSARPGGRAESTRQYLSILSMPITSLFWESLVLAPIRIQRSVKHSCQMLHIEIYLISGKHAMICIRIIQNGKPDRAISSFKVEFFPDHL
jgi:hypothetical protein